MAKSQGQSADLWKNVALSISFDPFSGKLLNLVQCMPLELYDPNLCSGHMVKGQGQTTFFDYTISFDSLFDGYQTRCTG